MRKTKIFFIGGKKNEELEKLKTLLEKENYEIHWKTEMKAESFSEENFPDIIFIDYENDYDDIEFCYNLRENPRLNRTFIVLLSTKNDMYSQIAAYNAGADDYILKPVNYRVLVHKIKSLARRAMVPEQTKAGPPFIGGIKIDREQYLVTRKSGEEMELPRKEFELLSLLMSNPGRVFKREEILEKIWNSQSENKSRTIDVHVRRLREKIGEKHIKTVKGIGYSFQS